MFFLTSICNSEANFKIICFSGGMTNNHVSKWEHCFVCCYFGLAVYAQSLLGSPVPNRALFPDLLPSHGSSILFFPWRERSQHTNEHLWLTALARQQLTTTNWHLQLCFPPPCRAATWNSISSLLEVTYQFQKHRAGNRNYFLVAWKSTVLEFGQHSPLVYQQVKVTNVKSSPLILILQISGSPGDQRIKIFFWIPLCQRLKPHFLIVAMDRASY